MTRFFGSLPGDARATHELPLDWARYVAAYPHIPARLKELGIGKFWASPEVLAIIGIRGDRALPRLGRWYANTPSNCVQVERGFAMMRRIEGDSARLSMKPERLNELLIGRANKDLVRQLHLGARVPAPSATDSCGDDGSWD